MHCQYNRGLVSGGERLAHTWKQIASPFLKSGILIFLSCQMPSNEQDQTADPLQLLKRKSTVEEKLMSNLKKYF